jgi:hypothetical protein
VGALSALSPPCPLLAIRKVADRHRRDCHPLGTAIGQLPSTGLRWTTAGSVDLGTLVEILSIPHKVQYSARQTMVLTQELQGLTARRAPRQLGPQRAGGGVC